MVRMDLNKRHIHDLAPVSRENNYQAQAVKAAHKSLAAVPKLLAKKNLYSLPQAEPLPTS